MSPKILKKQLIFSAFLMASILLLGNLKPAQAIDGIMNGKITTGYSDDYIFWLQTYDPDTAPYFFDKFYVGKNGSVGIGTSAPNYTLDVNGSINGTAVLVNGVAVGSGGSQWVSGSGGAIYYTGGNVGVGATDPQAKLDDTGSFKNSLMTTHSALGGAGDVLIMADNNGALFSTSTANFMGGLWGGIRNANIWNGDTGAGSVGIGTTNPQAKLDISGTLQNNSTITFTSLGGGGARLVTVDNSGTLGATTTSGGSLPSGTLGQTLRYGASGWESTSTVFVTGGSVGIGTTNPGGKLQVVAGASQYAGIFQSDQAATTWISTYAAFNLANANATTNNHAMFSFSDTVGGDGAGGIGVKFTDRTNHYGDMYFFTKGTDGFNQRLYIQSTGNVGIGTTNPLQKLQVAGTIRTNLTGTSSRCLYVDTNGDIGAKAADCGTATGGDNLGNHIATQNIQLGNYWLSGDSGNEGVFVKSDGNVGIGTSNPQTKLDVNGTLNTNSTVTFSLLNNSGIKLVTVDSSGTLGATTTLIGGPYLPLSGGTMAGHINLNGMNIVDVYDLNVTHKLTVYTIDPLYKLNGLNYSTFAPSIAGGVKEEYVGKIKITKEVWSLKGNKSDATREYETVVDFAKIEEGSDLWVWRQVVDFNQENIDVVITPYGSFAQVYYLIEGNKLIFRADRPIEISYRLSGKRFDWRDWPTKAKDQTEQGLEIKNTN